MKSMRIGFRVGILALVIVSGCAEADRIVPGAAQGAVVYGTDNRQNAYEVTDPAWAQRMRQSAVVLMNQSMLDVSNPAAVRVLGQTLGTARNLCPDQWFRDERVAGFCSGTLVGDDLVLTAGHCVTNKRECSSTRFVFGYVMDSPTGLAPLTAADVFKCAAIVARVETSTVDYALLRLDRAATPRFTPAPVRAGADAVTPGEALVVIGAPSGLPLKYDDGGRVRDARAGVLDYFVANTDTFGGNSGSGVYLAATGEVAGILVRGETDYVLDAAAGCYRVNVCSETGCSGEDSTYVARAVDGLCAKVPGAAICPVPVPFCGDGTCDAGEDAVSCPADCGGSPVPATWVCDPALYAAGDGCHCKCGARDPDCDATPLPALNCKAGWSCSADGRCVKP